MHEQLAVRTICGALVEAEPTLADDVFFGAFTCLDLEDRVATHLLDAVGCRLVSDVPSFEHPDVVICPGGPMLLRGDHVVEDDDGVAHRTTRPVSAVCRCGKSATQSLVRRHAQGAARRGHVPDGRSNRARTPRS